jgi:hypothetical protein
MEQMEKEFSGLTKTMLCGSGIKDTYILISQYKSGLSEK